MFVAAFILLVWAGLSVGLVAVGVYCMRLAVGHSTRAAATRLGLVAGAVTVLATAALHNPLTVHLAQSARADEMSQWQGRSLVEFEQRYGPPDYGSAPFLSWRPLAWYSPLRWGSVTLSVLNNGQIGAVWVRGFREAFS